MPRGYATRSRGELGEESPLSTKASRDRLARPPISDFGTNDDEDFEVSRRREEEQQQQLQLQLKQAEERKKSAAKAAALLQVSSPPNEKFRKSSPKAAEVTFSSPQFSRIESTSPGKSVSADMANIRNSVKEELMNSIDDGSTTEGTDDTSQNVPNVTTTRNRFRKTTDPHTTPKRATPKPVQRTLSNERSREWLFSDNDKKDETDSTTTTKSSRLLSWLLMALLVFVIVSAVFLPYPFFDANFRNRFLFRDQPFGSTSVSREKFLEDFNVIRKEQFPSQIKRTWSVIGSSIKSLFDRNLTMPVCILLVGNSTSGGQDTANCLASKLADSFHRSVLGQAAHNLEPLDSSVLSGLDRDDAKRRLFDTLNDRLTADHTFTLLNVEKLSGHVAMALHAFCDEGSNAAAFPLSTLFMTIENKDVTSPSGPEARADALLNKAWEPDLGQDKVSSLISRVAVSVADVTHEPSHQCN